MALRQGNKYKAFSQGVELRGPLALGTTIREGGARAPRRTRDGVAGSRHGAEHVHGTAHGTGLASSESTAAPTEASEAADAEIVMDRALRLVALLRDAPEVQAPAGVPCEGKVVSFDNAVSFVNRYRRFLRDIGPELACPRITFHWTSEENFRSIVESNLRVPDPEYGVKKKHGAAFGRGIYTCPNYKMAKEDFAYGASATFACLALTGRQLSRHHGKGHGLSESHGPGFDSVVGHLPNRNCDTWVLPESDQILPCFLVDDVAIPAAVDMMREAINILREPWPLPIPNEAQASEGEHSPAEDTAGAHERDEPIPTHDVAVLDPGGASGYANADASSSTIDEAASRWRRRNAREKRRNGTPKNLPQGGLSAEGAALQNQSLCDGQEKLPYGGDIQAAMRAQDRQALQVLLAARDKKHAQMRPNAGGGDGIAPEFATSGQYLSRSSAASPIPVSACDAASANMGSRRWSAKGARPAVHESAGPDSDQHQLSPDAHLGEEGVLSERGGNLLEATEEFLIHQCNCVYSGKAQGIAEAVFRACPAADVYNERAARGRPYDIPGTISVHGRIVNLYGQMLPGKPADDAPPGGWPGARRFVNAERASEDTRAARFRWFEACLQALPRALPGDRPHRIAFPARIGCGLAGGKWGQYLGALRRFAQAHPDWRVVVYDVELPADMVVPSKRSKDSRHPPVKPAQSRDAGNPAIQRTLAPGKNFWSRAVFEARRRGEWQPYGEEQQHALRAVLQRGDDCDEALVNAERHNALASLAEIGAYPKSLGALPPSEAEGGPATSSASTRGLVVQLPSSTGVTEVSLAPIVTSAGFGHERSEDESQAPVRLSLPAVQEGELRLPADLDEDGCAPAPRQCGRLVENAAELAALADANGNCGICLGELCSRKRTGVGNPVVQLHCGHVFHEACLVRWFEERRRCPTCKRRYGHVIGNQPSVGTMSWKLESGVRLAGFPDSFTIVLQFRFPHGKDSAGQHYRGRTQQAYLPHDDRGKLILELFQLAFRRRVLFDLRVSATDNKYWPAFNIHLKTATSGGPERFGFPDDGYFQRVVEELRENGVILAELH